jgi:tRNA(fMet)-specific endonuclease VapC
MCYFGSQLTSFRRGTRSKWAAACSTRAEDNHNAIDDFVSGLTIFEMTTRVTRQFGDIKALLRAQVNLIEDFDLLLAATAIEYDLILVTNNTAISEFGKRDGRNCNRLRTNYSEVFPDFGVAAQPVNANIGVEQVVHIAGGSGLDRRVMRKSSTITSAGRSSCHAP